MLIDTIYCIEDLFCNSLIISFYQTLFCVVATKSSDLFYLTLLKFFFDIIEKKVLKQSI